MSKRMTLLQTRSRVVFMAAPHNMLSLNYAVLPYAFSGGFSCT